VIVSFLFWTYLDKMSASIEASAITEYFKRKSIFITGATG
jgi:FlaA1/EpsC-like NDP-sugar epimerase